MLWKNQSNTSKVSAILTEQNRNTATTIQLADSASAVQEPFDIATEQARLRAQQIERANPVKIEKGSIRIDESAMLYDTVYPIRLSDTTYHIVFTSDGAIEIYEVAP